MMKRYLIGLIVCVVAGLVFELPQILFQYPNLLDIAETWSFGSNIIPNILAEFYNQERFRPMYVFTRTLLNNIFQYHAPFYFLSFGVFLGLTLFLIYFLTKSRNPSSMLYCVMSVILLISPVTLDTYWRLGTAENIFVVFLLASLITIFYKKYYLTIISMILLMASKETGVFYVPIFLTLFILMKRWWEAIILGIIYLLYLYKILYLVRFAVAHTGAYTSLFARSVTSVTEMMNYSLKAYGFYFVLWLISIGLFLYRLWKMRIYLHRDDLLWGLFLIGINCAGIIALLSFHNKYQPYYVFPWLVTMLVSCLWELSDIKNSLRYGIIVCISVLYIAFQIPNEALQRAVFWQHEYSGDGALIAFIEKNKDSTAFVFDTFYRPELQSALEVLTKKSNDLEGYTHKTIVLKGEHVRYSDAQILCGRSVIGTLYCKWVIL